MATSGGSTRTLEEQMALLQQHQQPKAAAIQVQGGSLKDRLQLLEAQRAKDAQIKSFATTDASQVTDDLIFDRVKWLQEKNQKKDNNNEDQQPTKQTISVQGGNLKDRLRLLEEQKKRDAEKLISYTTDESQVTKELIQDRLGWIQEQSKNAANMTAAEKQAIVVEGGKLEDRLKLLEEQRQKDGERVSYTTDESQVTKELIQDRLNWMKQQTENPDMTAEAKQAIVVEGGKLQDRLKLLEEQRQKDGERISYTTDESQVTKELIQDRLNWIKQQAENPDMTAEAKQAIVVEGGKLQDRLKMLEEQRQKDGELISYTTDESQVTKELIQDRLNWIKEQAENPDMTAEAKQAIVVEGGKLEDRLKLLEEQRQKDGERISYTTDESQVTKELIQDRINWIKQQAENPDMTAEAKQAIVVEGGKLEDRLKMLEEQRQKDGERVSYTTDESQVTKELIQDRLNWIKEQAENPNMTAEAKQAIIVEGGKLEDRLKLLEEQRQKDAQHKSHATDPSQVTYDFVHDRLAWIEEQSKNTESMTAAEREAIVVEGGRLRDRLKLLEEQREKGAAKLTSYTTDLSQVTDDLIHDRLAWIEEQSKKNSAQQDYLPEKAHAVVSSDLVAERMAWLKKNAAKANELPEKERLEVTRHLVAQRQAWLDEAKQKAAQLPEKERVEVTRGLISERISWLTAQKDKAMTSSRTERTQMTSDLIAERLEWLQQQNAENSSEDIETQIWFLSEQKEKAEQMTEDELQVMANALLDEKVKDLEIQKEMTAEMTAEQQIEVTNLLIDDRQAWLEGDDNFAKKQDVAEDDKPGDHLDESNRAMGMVANSISFWTEQKNNAPSMTVEERAQITSFLILEHIETLEQQLVENEADSDQKQSLDEQITFLREQNENVENIDHLMMINALVDEKIAGLEQQLATLV